MFDLPLTPQPRDPQPSEITLEWFFWNALGDQNPYATKIDTNFKFTNDIYLTC